MHERLAGVRESLSDRMEDIVAGLEAEELVAREEAQRRIDELATARLEAIEADVRERTDAGLAEVRSRLEAALSERIESLGTKLEGTLREEAERSVGDAIEARMGAVREELGSAAAKRVAERLVELDDDVKSRLAGFDQAASSQLGALEESSSQRLR